MQANILADPRIGKDQQLRDNPCHDPTARQAMLPYATRSGRNVKVNERYRGSDSRK